MLDLLNILKNTLYHAAVKVGIYLNAKREPSALRKAYVKHLYQYFNQGAFRFCN